MTWICNYPGKRPQTVQEQNAMYVWPLYVWALYVWPLYLSTLCEHSMCDHSMWDHSMWPLYVRPFYVSTLCVTTLLCEHSMCDHSVWDHSMWPLYVRPFYVTTLCETTLCEHSMCDHSVRPLYVWPLYVRPLSMWPPLCETTLCEHSMCDHSVWPLYVRPLYVTTLCETILSEHSMCDHSTMWPLYVWPLYYVSTLCVTTLCETTLCDHSTWDHSMWPLYVRPLYVSTLCVTTLREHSTCDHSMWDHSMWALYVWPLYVPLYVRPFYVTTLCVTTLLCDPSMWDHSMWALYVWALCVWPLYVRRALWLQFLGRMLQNTEKYENYHDNSTSVLGPDVAEHRKVRELPRKLDFSSWAGCCRTPKSTKITTKSRLQFVCRKLQRQKRQKSTSFIVKTLFKSIGEHRQVRELPRKMNIEEVEAPKNYENLQTKPVLDPFKSTADHRKVRELPRKMNIEEVEEPETTKIYRRNPFTPVAATRKLREFTDETNMQARKHENSDEFCPPPVRYLDLATPAFYYYRKNPKCYHTVWGTVWCLEKVPNIFSQMVVYFCWWIPQQKKITTNLGERHNQQVTQPQSDTNQPTAKQQATTPWSKRDTRRQPWLHSESPGQNK